MIELWTILKTIVEAVVLPVIGLLAWLFKSYADKVSEMDKRVTLLEKETTRDIAVIMSQLKTLDKKVDAMAEKIEKLVDRKK